MTVPLRIEHYQMLLEAKTGQLKVVFQAKLGWLVGNNYSRVGTPDWNNAKPALNGLIDELLSMVDVVEDRKLTRTLKVLKEEGEEPSEARILELQDDPRTAIPKRRELLRQAFDSVWPEEASLAEINNVKEALTDTKVLAEALRTQLHEVLRDGVDADEASSKLAESANLRDALHALIERAWPDSAPPTKRARFLAKLENADGFAEAVRET